MSNDKTHNILVRGLSKKMKNELKKQAKGKRLSVNSHLLTIIENAVIGKYMKQSEPGI